MSSTLKMLLSLPVQQGEGGVNLSRRRLFSGKRGDPVGDTQH